MKKKVLATLLSTVMVLGTLAGCGSSTADTSSSETATETKEEVKEETKTEAAAETQTQAAEGTASSDFSGEDPQLAKDFHILSIWAEDNDNGVLINSICKSYQEVNPNFTYEYELVSSDDLR